MAIPGIPQNFYCTTANGQTLAQWSITAGATSYDLQRSLDGVTFVSISAPAVTSYVDTTVSLGVQYYYQVASVNGDGTSPYSVIQTVIPVPTGEQSLSSLRLQSQQKADRVGSQFVTLPEWNSFINRAMFELYDLLISVYEDYYIGAPIQFTANGNTFLYPLPDGQTSYLNPISNQNFVAPALYKLSGVDLGLQTANNAYVTINKFQFSDRNNFVYPNTSSTIYGVFNLRYRMMGSNIEFIPTPAAGQVIRLWYIPRLTELLQDTDITSTGISGWCEYVVVRAAMYALQKEESDISNLQQELVFLKTRIQDSAANRDAGQPDKISNVRQNSFGNGWSNGSWGGGPTGGW